MYGKFVLSCLSAAALALQPVMAADNPAVAPPTQIENHLWNIVAYSSGQALIQHLSGGSILLRDGKVDGSPGCGAFFGDYAVSGNIVTFHVTALLAGFCYDQNIRDGDAVGRILNSAPLRVEMQIDRILLSDQAGNPQIVLTSGQ